MKHLIFAASLTALPVGAIAQDSTPLSAIDWLSQSVQIPVTNTITPPAARDEPPVASTAVPPSVTTAPLDRASPDPIGLLTPSVSALPRSLWAGSDEALLITLLQAEDINGLPAIQDLLRTLLLAEADPPLGATSSGGLFQARVDKLLDLGAIEPAQALLEQAQIDSPDLFRRWFDVALLTGTEDAACRVLLNRMDVAPTYAARIFCLARSGDWPAAALSLNTHIALGDLSDKEESLLARFLDPELFEGQPPLGPPDRMSPLMFRMYEAIGERMSTGNLPRAFAHADLRNTVGWKSQLEAAERLARHGAIAPSVLFALYVSRTPSASGGVWDRAAAVQAFDKAVRANDVAQIASALPDAWAAAKEVQVEIAFALEYGDRLVDLPLQGEAAEVAYAAALLSPEYEKAAISQPDRDPALVALARGNAATALSTDPMYVAIAHAFEDAPPPERLMALAASNQLGEAILRAMAMFEAGRDGDGQSLTDALAFFRAIGLEDTARRAGLQLLLLERET